MKDSLHKFRKRFWSLMCAWLVQKPEAGDRQWAVPPPEGAVQCLRQHLICDLSQIDLTCTAPSISDLWWFIESYLDVNTLLTVQFHVQALVKSHFDCWQAPDFALKRSIGCRQTVQKHRDSLFPLVAHSISDELRKLTKDAQKVVSRCLLVLPCYVVMRL